MKLVNTTAERDGRARLRKSPMTNDTNFESVLVEIPDDRMSVFITVDVGLAPNGVDLRTVAELLAAHGVHLSAEQLVKFAGANKRFSTPNGRVVIANGVAPKRGTAPTLAVVAKAVALSPVGEGEVVAGGAVLARIEGGTAGVDGVDVKGRVIPCVPPVPGFSVGAGAVAGEDRVVRAKVEGRFTQTLDGALRVFPLVEIAGDVDSTSQLKELGGDLRVSGCLKDQVVLRIEGSLCVAGSVEAQKVDVGEDLFVGGGLLGREHGVFTVARDLACRFATASEIKAGRNVETTADLLHCKVTCYGRAKIGERIQGSTIVANGGIECRSAVNSSRTTTILEAGNDNEVKALAAGSLPKVEGRLQKLEHGRMTIAPLIQRRDTLSPGQKQQVLRMAHENDRLEHEIYGLTAGFRNQYARSHASSKAEIVVEDMLGAGVVIRFAGMEAVVPTNLRGPIRLRPEGVGGAGGAGGPAGTGAGAEVRVVITDRAGKETVLPARAIADPVAMQLKRVMSKVA